MFKAEAAIRPMRMIHWNDQNAIFISSATTATTNNNKIKLQCDNFFQLGINFINMFWMKSKFPGN